MIFKTIGTEEAASTSSYSTIGGARFVKITNGLALGSEALVTVKNAADETIGTFSLAGQEYCFFEKSATDKMIASNVACLFAPIDISVANTNY